MWPGCLEEREGMGSIKTDSRKRKSQGGSTGGVDTGGGEVGERRAVRRFSAVSTPLEWSDWFPLRSAATGQLQLSLCFLCPFTFLGNNSAPAGALASAGF